MHTLPPFSIGCICSRLRLRAGNLAIRLRPAISEELPSGAYLRDFIQVNIVREQLVLVAACLRNNLAARIAEIAFSVEFPDVPGRLFSHAVDCAHEISVGSGVGGLFELPKVFAQPGHRRRRVEYNLRAI